MSEGLIGFMVVAGLFVAFNYREWLNRYQARHCACGGQEFTVTEFPTGVFDGPTDSTRVWHTRDCPRRH